MLTADKLKGIIPAMVTPFTKDDKVDIEGLRTLTNFVIENGVHAIMTTGGNGEFPHLLPDERKQVLEVVVDEANGRVPIIACTTACSTKETILNTNHAEDAGADAAIIVQPYYYKLPSQQLFLYYQKIAEETDFPIVVYNNPEYTGNNIDPKLMVQISTIEGIIGLKQSNYDISQTLEIIRQVGNKISVLTGIDSQLFPVLCIGGHGVFSTAGCVIPRQMVELYEAFEKGSIKKAYEMHMKLQVLNKFFEYDPGYVAPCKEALMMLGLPAGHVRSPLPALTKPEKEQIRKALVELGCSVKK